MITMKPRPELAQLFNEYLKLTGIRNTEAAGDLTLAHVILDVTETLAKAGAVTDGKAETGKQVQAGDNLEGKTNP